MFIKKFDPKRKEAMRPKETPNLKAKVIKKNGIQRRWIFPSFLRFKVMFLGR